MIDKKEILKLAQLARIEISEAEVENVQTDLNKILEFVSKLKAAPLGDEGGRIEGNRNVLREDKSPNSPGRYRADLLNQAPEKEKGYVRVRKIL